MRLPLLIIILSACETKGPALSGYTGEMCTSGGVASLEIEVGSETTALLLTARADDALAIDQVKTPNDKQAFYWEDWYAQPRYLTTAVWPLHEDLVLNWPIRAEDTAMRAGTWTVDIASIDASGHYKDDVCIELTVQSKQDADFNDGIVYIRALYADGVGEDPLVTAAVEAAVLRWEEVWAPHGLFPVVTYETSDLDPDLPYVGEGSAEVETIAAGSADDEITLIIGETIASAISYYGVSGSIPGSLVATPRSAVVLSWLANAGLDGVFSDADIRLMGETMAHEVSHYMGVFHPVEQTWEAWDAASDTTDCTTQESCESDLGDNLMFPYPLCIAGVCQPQDELSEIQTGILQRYTGTL